MPQSASSKVLVLDLRKMGAHVQASAKRDATRDSLQRQHDVLHQRAEYSTHFTTMEFRVKYVAIDDGPL